MKKEYLFKNVAENWLTIHRVGIKHGTLLMYQNNINKLNVFFSNKDIRHIEFLELQNFINNLHENDLSKSTIKKYKITLSQIFNFAISEKIIITNPANIIKIPKNAKVTTRRSLSLNETKLILDNVNLEFGLYAYMLLFLGLRRSELLALKFEDIDFEEKKVKIYKVVNFIKNKPVITIGLKNGNKFRYLPMIDKLLTILNPYKNEIGFIFKNDNNQPLSEHEIKKKWLNYQQNTGLTNITQHMIRHTYATMLYSSGVDIKTAQYLLGHNDIKTLLQIYTHLEDDMKYRNIIKFNSYINNLIY